MSTPKPKRVLCLIIKRNSYSEYAIVWNMSRNILKAVIKGIPQAPDIRSKKAYIWAENNKFQP